MQSIHMLIAVTSDSIRKCVTQVLGGTDIDVVAIVATSESVKCWIHNPDINFVLLESQLLDGDSLPLVHSIATSRPELPIVMLSTIDSPIRALLADECGVSSYLSSFDRHELLAEIRRHQLPHPSSILRSKDDTSNSTGSHGVPLPPWHSGNSSFEHC